MPDKHLMIAVDWYGPYINISDAKENARNDYDDGLYICIGKRAHERKRRLQYIGLSERLFTRLSINHHKLSDVEREVEFWLGEIATAEPSGRKLKVTRQTLDMTEWLHARFLELPLNNKKRKGLPYRSATVLNRWWKCDYDNPRRRRPHSSWPDLIDYPGCSLPVRLVWFGQKQRIISNI
ncbi:hypothetical protein [Ferruginivarius sediminum]|uniref:hypothetical protein n=1 Tax=Ferruginivarius sediminum TaxID=2661937 RepID=UPI0011C0657E|nr:hypothetical protein [Ferruginivarius sediminum]